MRNALVRSLVAGAVVAVAGVVVAVSASAGVVVLGGGKRLTAGDTTFVSAKISTGGVAVNTYEFHFETPFDVQGVHVAMEGHDGRPVAAGSALVGIDVEQGGRSKGFAKARGAADRCDASAGAGEVAVKVTAKSDLGAVRFRVAFAAKDASNVAFVRLDEFPAGTRSVLARPIPASFEGALLPVRNAGSSSVGFGRFELVGAAATTTVSAVTAEGFAAEIESGGRAFTLRGGPLKPSETVDVYVRFAAETDARAALVGSFDEN